MAMEVCVSLTSSLVRPQYKLINIMKKKKILVTGGQGYIGYHVVSKLLNKKNIHVIVLDSNLYASTTLDEFRDRKNLTVFKGDIRNISDLVNAVKDVDIVIALAAIVGDPACALNQEETYSTNYHSTELMVEICNYYKVKRLIFASSCSVYGADDIILNEGSKLNPLSFFTITRVMSEELILKKAAENLDWTILRFGTVFGWSKRMRFDLAVNFLTTKAYFTKEIDIIGGEQWRPFVRVQDVAEAVVKASVANRSKVSHGIFNVGVDKYNIQIKDIASILKKHVKELKINSKEIGFNDKRNYRVSFEKIRHHLNFSAQHSIEFGVKEIIKNLRKTKIDYLDEKYYNVKYLFKHLQI